MAPKYRFTHFKIKTIVWEYFMGFLRRKIFLVFFLGVIFLFASGGFASDLSKKEKTEYKVENLIVTAEKRVQNVQDIPMSVSVFSDVTLDNANITTANELMRYSPNVYLKKDSSQNHIVIRGITNFYGSRTSPVGFYIDDVCIPLNGMHGIDLVDIERIEILKGPQGTLYGRNSEAGVINIITKEPGDERSGKIFGEYNWYDTEHGSSPGYKAGASVSGPVIENKLYMGVAGQWKDSDGIMKNEFNGDDEVGSFENINGRAHIKWKANDKLKLSFIADALDYESGVVSFNYVQGPLAFGRNRVSYDSPYNEWTQESNGQVLKAEYKGSLFDLASITSRRYYKNYSESDFDCTSFKFGLSGDAFFKDKDTTYAQELRVSSKEKEIKLKWLAGLYFFDEDTDVSVAKLLKKGTEIRNTSVDTSGYALFGQGTYLIGNDFHITAGLRYDFVNLDGNQNYQNNSAEKQYEEDLDYAEILPKLTFAYDLSEAILTYATIAKGYIHGGYNYSKATELKNLTYDEESTWNYEIGAKTSWFKNRISANISAFYIQMKDKQVAEWGSGEDVVGAVQMIRNAADAHSQGIELEIKIRPFRGLDLIAGAGIIESEIDDWVATEYNKFTGKYSTYDYSGKKLPNVPEYNYNLGIQYSHLSGFYGRADLFGTGKYYNDSKNDASESGYELVNLTLGYQGEKYDISCWCKNMFDEEFYKARIGSGDYQMGTEGEPRMFGVKVSYRF